MRARIGSAAATAWVALALTGCGGSELTVQVLQGGGEGEMRPVKDHVVRFLPYDRDSLFAALAAEAPEPEPQIPEDLKREFEEIAGLQEVWRQKDAEWQEVRDSLKRLSDQLRGMDRRSREYLQAFQRFTDLEARERQLDREKDAAFAAFDTRQQVALARADSLRAVITSWEDVAFQEYADREAEILERVGRQVHEDTTNTEGLITRQLRGTPWWVHTRLSLPLGELYWNEQVDPGAVDTLRLTAENAEERFRP